MTIFGRLEILENVPRKLRVEFSGAIYHVMSRGDRLRAERIIAEELGRLGWTDAHLRELRKSDPAKLALAARLRRETTLTVDWIAHRLHLGTRKSAAVKLHRWSTAKQKVGPDPAKTMV